MRPVLRLLCLGERSNGPAGCDRPCGRVDLRDDGHFIAVLSLPSGRRSGEEVDLCYDLTEQRPGPAEWLGMETRLVASCGRHHTVETDPDALLDAARAAVATRRVRTLPLPRAADQ